MAESTVIKTVIGCRTTEDSLDVLTKGCNLRCPYCPSAYIRDNDRTDCVSMLVVMDPFYDADRQKTPKKEWLTIKEPASCLAYYNACHNLKTLFGTFYQLRLETTGADAPLPELKYRRTMQFPAHISLAIKAPRSKYESFMSDEMKEQYKDNSLLWVENAVTQLANLVYLTKDDDVPITYDVYTTVHKKLLSEEDLTQLKKDWLLKGCFSVKDEIVYTPAVNLADHWYLEQYHPSSDSLKDEPTYSDEELSDIAIRVGAHIRGVSDELVKKVNNALKGA